MRESGLPTPADATKTNDLARRAAPPPDPTPIARHQADRVHELLVPSPSIVPDRKAIPASPASDTPLPLSVAKATDDDPSSTVRPSPPPPADLSADIPRRPRTRVLADSTDHNDDSVSESTSPPPPEEFRRIAALGYQIPPTTPIPAYAEVIANLDLDPRVARNAPDDATQVLETLSLPAVLPRPDITAEQYISVATQVLAEHDFPPDALHYASDVAFPSLMTLHADHEGKGYTGAVDRFVEHVTDIDKDLPRTVETLQDQIARTIDFVEQRPQIIDAVKQVFAGWVRPRAADEIQTNIVAVIEMGSYAGKYPNALSDVDAIIVAEGQVTAADYEAFTTHVREGLAQIALAPKELEVWPTNDGSPTFQLDKLRAQTAAADYVTTMPGYRQNIIATDAPTRDRIAAALAGSETFSDDQIREVIAEDEEGIDKLATRFKSTLRYNNGDTINLSDLSPAQIRPELARWRADSQLSPSDEPYAFYNDLTNRISHAIDDQVVRAAIATGDAAEAVLTLYAPTLIRLVNKYPPELRDDLVRTAVSRVYMSSDHILSMAQNLARTQNRVGGATGLAIHLVVRKELATYLSGGYVPEEFIPKYPLIYDKIKSVLQNRPHGLSPDDIDYLVTSLHEAHPTLSQTDLRHHIKKRYGTVPLDLDFIRGTYDPISQADTRLTFRDVLNRMPRLNQQTRRLFELKYFSEPDGGILTDLEVGQLLGMSRKEVSNKLARLYRRLKTFFTPEDLESDTK